MNLSIQKNQRQSNHSLQAVEPIPARTVSGLMKKPFPHFFVEKGAQPSWVLVILPL